MNSLSGSMREEVAGLMTTKEVARYLRVSESSVRKNRNLQQLRIEIGERAVRFRRTDIESWLSTPPQKASK
jgi:excisionase family DNA binding protein